MLKKIDNLENRGAETIATNMESSESKTIEQKRLTPSHMYLCQVSKVGEAIYH